MNPTPHHPSETVPGPAAEPVVDTRRKFVRPLGDTTGDWVSFEFAIGWPELSVELLLPRPAFEDFCRDNEVIRLELHPETTGATPGAPDQDDDPEMDR